jgi:hypothetical protein
MDLGPLLKEEALSLAGAFIDATQRVALACIERAEGNPLFLEQLLRNAEEGESEAVPARDPPWSAVGAAALRSWRRHPPTSPKSRRVRRSRFSGRRSICATLALMG